MIQRKSKSSPIEAGGKQASLRPRTIGGVVMSFGLYAMGFAIVIGGLIYGAYLVHMPGHWIAVGAIVLLGVGILTGVKATRQRDPAGQ
jgi:hypothetical protein